MNPLLQAIVENNDNELKNRELIDKWINIPDKWGYLPLEIARYLGKYDAAKLLGGKFPEVFKLEPHGAKKPVELSLEGFEKSLNIRYRPFLTFSSYSFFIQVLNQCPYILRSRSLASDNYEWTKTYYQELIEGQIAPICIKWIDPTLGYGAFATENIMKGQFIGEYTGIVRQLHRRHPDHNPYCFHYPTKFWSLKYLTVDSMKEGNLMRFINHSNQPNIHPLCLVDRRLLHQVLIAKRMIKEGEQLTFDYGEDYWIKRKQVHTG